MQSRVHPDRKRYDEIISRKRQAPKLSMDAINEKEATIDLLLINKGVAMTCLPATATEPQEYVGYGASVDALTGTVSIITDREVVARFPFDAPLSEIGRASCRERV